MCNCKSRDAERVEKSHRASYKLPTRTHENYLWCINQVDIE